MKSTVESTPEAEYQSLAIGFGVAAGTLIWNYFFYRLTDLIMFSCSFGCSCCWGDLLHWQEEEDDQTTCRAARCSTPFAII
jgi:hypothetical protein